ncbi:MAG: hypothetical protein K6A68_16315 [Clostridiales bacterium]|nr:hypothetical protein [Clostridiales bacterium]
MKKGLIAVCILLVAAIIWGGVSTSQKNAISTELDSVKAEVSSITASLTKAQEELNNAKEATQAAVEAAKAEAQATIDSLTEEKTALEGKITELNDQVVLVAAENADLKDNLQGVTEIIRSALALIDGEPAAVSEEESAASVQEETAEEKTATEATAEEPAEAVETPAEEIPAETVETPAEEVPAEAVETENASGETNEEAPSEGQ